jgi:hypothetical protein
MVYLVILCLAMYVAYNILILKRFGIPESLSVTSYLLEKKFYLFSILCIGMGTLLLPAWLAISPHELKMCVVYTLGGLILAGLTPGFHKTVQKPIHYTSAIVTSLGYVKWFIVTNYMVLVVNAFLFIVLTAIKRKSFVYHFENIIALTIMIYLIGATL